MIENAARDPTGATMNSNLVFKMETNTKGFVDNDSIFLIIAKCKIVKFFFISKLID